MAITRKYESKEDCVGLFIDENFDSFPSWTVTERDDFFDEWYCVGLLDGEDTDDEDELETFGITHAPMWSDWFIPNWWVRGFVEKHPEEVADMGFTLIYYGDYEHPENLFAIGVDGAGYSFRDTHFTRLYDAMGVTWHK